MFWRKEKLEYDILIPPLSKSREKLDLKETTNYFNWYIGKIDERVEYLSKYSKVTLDFSPKSIIRLWSWFLNIAEIEKTPKTRIEELKKEFKNNSFIETIINDNEVQFSLQTEYIIRDIGMYLGETFVKNHKNIYWTYYSEPKTDMFVNQPLLKGFIEKDFGPPCEVFFEPVHMVSVQASRLYDKSHNEDDLYKIYKIWEEKT